MTATDPRPQLAAMLAEKLAPAVETLAAAYAEDLDAGPPPPDDRALAERHRAGRAQLSHLRQLLAVLDWAGARMPEPEPAPVEEPPDGLDNPFGEPDGPDYDGSENEFHYRGEVWAGSRETSGFRAWSEDMERRFGPVPMDEGGERGPVDCHAGERKFVGRLRSPEFRAWRERQHRRTEEARARSLDRARKTRAQPRRMTKHEGLTKMV